VLEVHGLAKRYGEVVAVSELSLSVAAGTTLVLLGQNGAGKTTALRCMSGLLKPSAGRVLVGGIDSLADPDAVRAQVGLVPEVPGLYERMSGRAYLDYFGRVYELDRATRSARISDLLELFGLSDAADRWLGTFSKGMRQKVALIRATMHRPRLVLADEPTSALDPDSARIAWGYLDSLRAAGAALVVCTHNMEEARTLAGGIGIMARGRLLASGDLHALIRVAGLKKHRLVVERPTLEEVYLAIVGNREEDEARPA
jgi:ABC-2 type transport system ATP-binding protein